MKPSSALAAILPRIGYSPTPSAPPASRVVATAGAAVTPAKTLSLPPITPASHRGGSYVTVSSREKTMAPVRFEPRTLHRTFRGKYYDPGMCVWGVGGGGGGVRGGGG